MSASHPAKRLAEGNGLETILQIENGTPTQGPVDRGVLLLDTLEIKCVL